MIDLGFQLIHPMKLRTRAPNQKDARPQCKQGHEKFLRKAIWRRRIVWGNRHVETIYFVLHKYKDDRLDVDKPQFD